VEPDSNRRVLRCLPCLTVALSLDGEVGRGKPQADGLVEVAEAVEDGLESSSAGDRADHDWPSPESNDWPSPESTDWESNVFRELVPATRLHGCSCSSLKAVLGLE
jgi:hypothetical protein